MPEFSSNIGRFADNLEALGKQTHRVSIPLRDGFLARNCPSCGGFFEIDVDIEDFERLTCPYCCHEAEKSEFLTDHQRAIAVNAIKHEVRKALADAAGDPAGRLSPAQPEPQQAEHEQLCSHCALRFKTTRAALHCPRCGTAQTGAR